MSIIRITLALLGLLLSAIGFWSLATGNKVLWLDPSKASASLLGLAAVFGGVAVVIFEWQKRRA